MNQNKGIIGLGLIVAIVLGVVVVGGGAYYLGKSSNKMEVKNPENILPENQNQELGKINQNTNQPVVENSTTTQVVKDCDSSSKPSIKVLSPNGGEVYKAGDKITVKWESCNVPSNAKGVNIRVVWKGNLEALTTNEFNGTPNDGQELITLPTQEKIKDFYTNTFVVHIQMNIPGQNLTVNGDDSDNSFTINSSKTITWLKSPQFGLYYQNTLNIIEYYVDKYGKQVDKKDGMPMFYASWGEHQDSGITWGGNYEATNPTAVGGGSSCMDDNDFGIFEYGVSSITCLKGHVARVGRTSARNTITKEDLKVFGDFVLKNR